MRAFQVLTDYRPLVAVLHVRLTWPIVDERPRARPGGRGGGSTVNPAAATAVTRAAEAARLTTLMTLLMFLLRGLSFGNGS